MQSCGPLLLPALPVLMALGLDVQAGSHEVRGKDYSGIMCYKYLTNTLEKKFENTANR